MTQNTSPAVADPEATDDMLAAQPVGYWTAVANKAVINRLRDAMAGVDVSQPQWWALNQVDTDGEGPTRQEVAGRLADVADGPYEVPRAIDHLLARGWIGAGTGCHLHLTDAGRAAKARTKQLVTDLRAQIHDGITDEEYVTTLKVLRKMIHNIERSAALR